MLNELEQKIRKAIPELYIALGHGKPIQLNHVFDYVRKLLNYNCWKEIAYIIDNWNLKSNLLSEQSEELIKFINEL